MLAESALHEIDAHVDVAGLVVSADLHAAAARAVQLEEVVRLQQRVQELADAHAAAVRLAIATRHRGG